MQFFKSLIFAFLLFLINVNSSLLIAQNTHQIYLIGDAGEDKVAGKTLLVLQKHLERDSNSTVIFLGDNAYPAGINKIDFSKMEKPYLHDKSANLFSQLSILKNYKGNVLFVPGNHDWKAQKKKNAIQSIKNESFAIESYFKNETKINNEMDKNFISILDIKNNSPVIVDVNSKITILLFDSQYFFQCIKGISKKKKRGLIDNFFANMDSIISIKGKEGRKIIIASHHPIFTNGYHARSRQPLRFLFNYSPFWLLGKLGIDRWLSQDIIQPFYKKYRKAFNSVLEKHKGLIITAGHDHNLQLFKEKENIHIVSGAGSKIKKLRKQNKFESIYQTDKKKGFVKLSFNESQVLKISFISEDDELMFER